MPVLLPSVQWRKPNPGDVAVLNGIRRDNPRYRRCVGHWLFNEMGGDIVCDVSGYKDNGTMSNMNPNVDWVITDRGPALDLVDNTDRVRVNVTPEWSTTRMSIAAWVKSDSWSDAVSFPHYIFGHTSSFPVFANRIQLYVDDTGGNLDLGLGDTHSRHLNIQALSIGVWYFIILVWNSGSYEVYVDRISKATGSYTGLSSLTTVADIGNHGGGSAPDQAWEGPISDVRIYNRVLTSREVWSLFRNPYEEFFPRYAMTKSPIRFLPRIVVY